MKTKRHIVIIDDDKNFLKVVKKMLETHEDYTVSCYLDENKLLENFYKEVPDLVIIDINLTITNGIKLCYELSKNSFYSFPVIFVSTENKYSVIQDFLLTKTNIKFLKKPIVDQQLTKAVSDLLAS